MKTQYDIDVYYMGLALEEAKLAYQEGEVPIGAILVHNDTIIARAHNQREKDHDATKHAELMVIQKACQILKRWRLSGTTLYVTIEPCPMCAGAIINSRVDRVVYGSYDSKAGAVESLFHVLSHASLNHAPEVISGIRAEECRAIIKDFFRMRREENKRKKAGIDESASMC